MTSADLLAAYSEQAQNFYTVLSLLITFISAYLVATYLVAERLSWFQFVVLSVMFCIICFDLTRGFHMFGETMNSVASELELRSMEEPALRFLIIRPWDNLIPRGPQIFWVIATLVSVGFASYNKYRRDA